MDCDFELPVMSLWRENGSIWKIDERTGSTLVIEDARCHPMLKTRERASLITVTGDNVVHESVWVGPSWHENIFYSVIREVE
jgi:hypothetical protein